MAMRMPPFYFALADSLIFVLVALLLFVGIVYGFYTRAGSGIEQRRFEKQRSTERAPGAAGPSETSGRDEGESPPAERGTDATAGADMRPEDASEPRG
jgi:hypothetical protein